MLGYIAFLDPPKETAAAAIATLKAGGVQVKILTGDNDIVTRKICHEVDLPVDRIVLGSEMTKLLPDELARLAETATVGDGTVLKSCARYRVNPGGPLSCRTVSPAAAPTVDRSASAIEPACRITNTVSGLMPSASRTRAASQSGVVERSTMQRQSIH